MNATSLLEGGVEDVNLSDVDELIRQLRTKEKELEDAELKVKNIKAEVEKIETVLLPETMGNITQIKTSSGATVTVKKVVRANVKKEDRSVAFAWMDKQGYGELIKTTIEISYGRGELEDAKKTAEMLKGMGIPAHIAEEVHWQTLNAWAREQVEAGLEFPSFIGIYEGKKAEVKYGK